MALSVLASLATLKAQARAFVRARFQNRAVGDANFLGKVALIAAMALFGLQKTVEQVDNDSPPNPKTSTLGIDSWGFTFGLPSNAGGFGRNQATPSSGGLAPVTGTPGNVVAAGQQLTAPDGVTVLQLAETGTIPFTGAFFAVTPGTVGNLPIGTQLTWISPPVGCDGSVTLSSELAGGLDRESDVDFLDRTLARVQQPPKGGANIDYITWALEQPGVFKAYVYPLRDGSGTVQIVIVAAGSGAGRIPTETVRLAVSTFIALVQPTVVEEAGVLVPLQPDDKDLTIRVQCVLASKYSWDWVDTGGSWTVAGYSASDVLFSGAPSLTLSAAADPSLISAISLGARPRVQVVVTTANASVIPAQPRAIAYDAGTHKIALDAPLTPAPTVGDQVYAGSYAAPLIAQDVLNYVDSLGPSRASVYADQVNVWDDTVSVFTVGATVVDSLDADGLTRLVARVPGGGVTIAVGSGSPTATDYEPADDLDDAPELARAARVVVTQS